MVGRRKEYVNKNLHTDRDDFIKPKCNVQQAIKKNDNKEGKVRTALLATMLLTPNQALANMRINEKVLKKRRNIQTTNNCLRKKKRVAYFEEGAKIPMYKMPNK